VDTLLDGETVAGWNVPWQAKVMMAPTVATWNYFNALTGYGKPVWLWPEATVWAAQHVGLPAITLGRALKTAARSALPGAALLGTAGLAGYGMHLLGAAPAYRPPPAALSMRGPALISRMGLLPTSLKPEEMPLVLEVAKQLPLVHGLQDLIRDEALGNESLAGMNVQDFWSSLGKISALAAPVLGAFEQGGWAQLATQLAQSFGSPSRTASPQPPTIVAQPTPPPPTGRIDMSHYRGIAKQYGVREALYQMSRDHPAVLNLLTDVVQRARTAKVYRLTDEMQERISSGVRCDMCDRPPNYFSGSIPAGTFFRSPLVQGRIANSMDGRIHGEISMAGTPFPITINSQQNAGRGLIAVAHELGHLVDAVYKFGLPHHQVHELGVFFATDGLAVLDAYRRHVGTI
jgi:hypothetical protein